MRAAILILLILATTAQARPRAFAIGQTEQVTRGLVAYYSMRNSGTTVYDEWGTNNGTSSGSPTLSATNGVVGNGLNLDGTDDYVTISDSAAISFGSTTADSPFSVAFWVKSAAFAAGDALFKGKLDASEREWRIILKGASSEFIFALYDETGVHLIQQAITTPSLDDGSWRFVTVTYTGSRAFSGITVYFDGAVRASSGSSSGVYVAMHNTANPLYIGAVSTLRQRASIDEVRIYNRELTGDEIKQLYRMGAIPKGIK